MSVALSNLTRPVRIHRAWTILAVLVVVQIVGQSISMAAGIMVAPLHEEGGGFGWDLRVIGGAIAVYYFVGAVTAPLAGMIGDRYGARPIMLGCGILYLVSMLLVGSVSQVWQFFVFFGVLLAITQAFTFVPLQASIGGWFKRRLGLATSLLQGAGGVGAASLALVVARLLEVAGWRDTFWLIAVVGGGLIILSSLFFRSRPADTGIQPYGARDDDPPERVLTEAAQRLRMKVFGQHMRRTRAFWNLPTIHGLGCAGHGIVLIYVIPFAYQQDMSLTAATVILALISIFSIAGRFLVPILAERISGKPVMMVALFIQGITVPILFFAHDPWIFYLFGALFGLGFGGEMSAYLVVNRQYFGPGPLATLYGWEIMGAMLGHAVATALGGLLIYITGSYVPVFIMSMAFSWVGVLVILALESSRQVLIPYWEDSLPPEARISAVPPPPEHRPVRAVPEATPGD